ncbi:hypothetical protein C3941_23650 [Kaistia algarum]|uniref:hypothetical protein n=1 Tax=Kaistia algarum TaxID=2083279 RepID=UPI000CE7E8FF|nr:hypothetical protein [Kaistia algarum]MCX5513447.1 hypothetical protein [Kaistia algarum]PPE77455.1 hypothetical protein C3941_23650 [Kaistia algarum]
MTWIPTRSGQIIDLLTPSAQTIDFEQDVAPALALIPRFAGQAGSLDRGYSVAQHCILGCDALHAETGSALAAFAFLLHDAHEAYIGDITTPMQAALDRAIAQFFGHHRGGYNLARDGKRIIANKLDRAIYEAAGLRLPLPAEIVGHVTDMDRRLLKRERDDLLPAHPRLWEAAIEEAGPIPSIPGQITVWTPGAARLGWLTRLRGLQAKLAAQAPS